MSPTETCKAIGRKRTRLLRETASVVGVLEPGGFETLGDTDGIGGNEVH